MIYKSTKDYVLMRLVYCSLVYLFLFGLSSQMKALSPDSKPEFAPLDSLVSHWNKQQTSMPYYEYAISDFNDKPSLAKSQTFIIQKGIGAVVLSNGRMDEVQQWNKDVTKASIIPPIFIAQLPNVFELPFEYADFQPSQLEVLCVSDDSIAYQLGISHGILLTRMGFNVVKLINEPRHFASPEWKKVALYFEGLKKTELFFSLSAKDEMFLHLIGWSHIMIYDDDYSETGKSLQKYRKKNRKKVDFKGLYKSNYDSLKTLEVKENVFYEGAGLVLLPDEIINELNQPKESSKTNISDLKKSVRGYYAVWKKVKNQEKGKMFWMDQDSLNLEISNRSKLLLQNRDSIVPIQCLRQTLMYTLFEHNETGKQAKQLVDYYKVGRHLDLGIISLSYDSLLKIIPKKGGVIIDLTPLLEVENLDSILVSIAQLQEHRKVISLLRGNPKSLKQMTNLNTLLWSPDESNESLVTLVQMAFGSEKVLGQLPVFLHKTWNHKGEIIPKVTRIKYQKVALKGIKTSHLDKIDSLVGVSIQNQEMPGCQIMMLYKGAVVYDQSFGFLSYDSLVPVQWQSIYDIASVTKTTATVPLVMNALERGLLSVDDSLSMHFEILEESDKSRISLSSMLYHQSGLKSYYPFWKDASYDSVQNSFLYKQIKNKRRKTYEYLSLNWEDSVNAWVKKSEFTIRRNADSTFGYLYSDLGFMLLKQIVELRTKRKFDFLADSLLYDPLGMDHTMYNAYRFIDSTRLAPTEDDTYFRKRLLVGEVHDKNAALLGGVAGHAGLFSNANDLAKYMQMILQNGSYGGVQYFDAATVERFITKPVDSERRALGWDKPNYSVGNSSKYASEASFGHSGFTGTLVWADPVHELVYVFLSNRIHPDPQNYKLIESNTRTKIHDIMYESILSSDNIPFDEL